MTEENKPKKPTVTLPIKKTSQLPQTKIPKPNTKGFGGTNVIRRTGRGR